MARKTLPLMALFLSSLILLALFVVPALAQGEGFSETFDDPTLPGWEHSPEVIVVEGVLRIASGNFAARMGVWGDLDMSLDLRYDNPGMSEIHYHTTDSGAYILLIGNDRLTLLRTGGEGSEPTELAGADWTGPASGTWIKVRITLTGGQHSISLDDAVLLSADDAAPITTGSLLFVSQEGRTTEVDNINLTVAPPPGEGAPGGETPPDAPPTEVVPAPTETTSTTWQDLIQSLSASQGSTFDTGTFVVNLVLAVITSFILSRVYVYWGASLSNRRKFAANFMLVTVTTTFIILVVRSSVALSLGLVGALSIIRFRAAIKEPEELAYLFFAISLGIGLGDNQRLVTLLTLVVVIGVLGLARLLRQLQADVNLNLSISSRAPAKVGMQQVMEALEKHCAKLRLLRFDENAEALEMSFVIEFRHTSDLEQARAALLALSDKLEISFMDNKGIW